MAGAPIAAAPVTPQSAPAAHRLLHSLLHSQRKILQMTYHSNRITLFSDIDKGRLSDFVESVFFVLTDILITKILALYLIIW